MTVKKRVGSLPTYRLDVRHSVDYSSSDHFSSDDSSSSSSSETSLDSSTHALFDFASSHSSSDHSLPVSPSGTRPNHHLCSLVPSIHRSSTDSEIPYHDSSSASPSRKRSITPVAFVPLSSPTLRALSYARVDLLPSPKRIRRSELATDLEGCSEDSFEPYVPREVRLGVDFKDESSEPSRSRGTDLDMDVDVVRSDGIKIDPETQAKINECFAYADTLIDRGIDARVVVEAIDRDEIETGMRGPVEVRVDKDTHPVRFQDHTEEILVHCIYVIEGVQRDQGHRKVATGQQSADMLERIQELERDNMILRDIVDVESQRVTRFWRRELRVLAELRALECQSYYLMTLIAVRQAQLVDTDTESDPEEAPSETEESQPDRTSSRGMPARIAKAELLLSTLFSVRGIEYLTTDIHASISSLALPVRKRYRGTEEDEEDKSSDADDERESLGYGAARRRALESTEEIAPSTYEVGQSSRSMPEQEGAERVSAFRQPTLVTWVDPEDGRVDLWHVIYDIQRDNHDLRRQLAEERRKRLELTDRVARMERRQESGGE
ncbi:hypothetical protein Tco_0518219 [Tanacetum coccineum]